MLIFVLAVDLLIFQLSINHYYFAFLKYSGIPIPAMITVNAIFLFVRSFNISTFELIAISIIAFLILVVIIFVHSIKDFTIDSVTSPSGKETLTIEHRNATLGETTHIYNFYRNTTFPGVIKKINKDKVTIITHESSSTPDDLDVLGINNVKWVEGEGVIFNSSYAKTKVDFFGY